MGRVSRIIRLLAFLAMKERIRFTVSKTVRALCRRFFLTVVCIFQKKQLAKPKSDCYYWFKVRTLYH